MVEMKHVGRFVERIVCLCLCENVMKFCLFHSFFYLSLVWTMQAFQEIWNIERERKLKTNTEFRLLLWLPLLVFLLVQFFFSLFLSKIRLIAILHFIPFSYTTRKKVNKENGVKIKIDINWIVLVCGCWNFISPYCIAFVTRDPSGNA